jgi:hypothetical protein
MPRPYSTDLRERAVEAVEIKKGPAIMHSPAGVQHLVVGADVNASSLIPLESSRLAGRTGHQRLFAFELPHWVRGSDPVPGLQQASSRGRCFIELHRGDHERPQFYADPK